MFRAELFARPVCWLLIIALSGCYATGPLKLDQPVTSLPLEVGDQAVIHKKNGQVVEIIVTYIGEEPYIIGNRVTRAQGNSANSTYGSGKISGRAKVGGSVQIMFADIDSLGGKGAKEFNSGGTAAIVLLTVILILGVVYAVGEVADSFGN